MAIRERLVYAIDVVTDGANRGLSNFRQAVAQADTTTGKFKAGASSAFTSIQQNAGNLAMAGGAALVAFGAKAVSAFQETAIEAGKFSDATGLAVDDASRWIEVADDVGVSAETMQGAFVRLNKAIGEGKLEEFGVELRHTADGAVDVSATMLDAIRVIGGIKDPTERAAAAQKAFGRSYAEAAEIIFDSADNVQKKLEEVSGAKVISEDELEKARRFRESMDNLKDVVEDLTITAGETLVPVLEDVATTLTDISKTADDLKLPELLKFGTENTALHRVRQLGGAIDDLVNGEEEVERAYKASAAAGHAAAIASEAHAEAVTEANDVQIPYVEGLIAAGEAQQRSAKEAEKNAKAVEKLTRAYEELLDELEDRSAFLDVQDAFDDMADKADKSLRDQERDVIQAKQAVASYAEELGNVPPEVATQIIALIDAGRYQEAMTLLDNLERTRTARVNVVLNNPGRIGDTVVAGGRLTGGLQQFAEGGVVGGPVGSPQLAVVHGGETVLPTHKAGAVGGGVTINAYITANDSESVFDKLAREVRAKGPGPVRRALGID